MSKPTNTSAAIARCLILARQGLPSEDTQGNLEYDEACIEFLQRMYDDVQTLRAQLQEQIKTMEHTGGRGLTPDKIGEPQLDTLEVDIDSNGDINKTVH